MPPPAHASRTRLPHTSDAAPSRSTTLRARQASLHGQETRHAALLETLATLRAALADREASVAASSERVKALEGSELPAAVAKAEAAEERAAAARVEAEGAEKRVAEIRAQFDAAQAQATELTKRLATLSAEAATAHAASLEHQRTAQLAEQAAAAAQQQRAGEAKRGEEAAAASAALRVSLRERLVVIGELQAKVDGALEAREAAEEAVEVMKDRLHNMQFEVTAAADRLKEEQSKGRLKDVEVAAAAEHIAALKERVAEARRDAGDVRGTASGVHGQLKVAAAAAEKQNIELEKAKAEAARLSDALAAREEQLQVARSKLSAAADGGRTAAGHADHMVADLNEAREEARVKEEQVTLLRQSVQVLERELTAKEQRADALRQKLSVIEREVGAKDDELLVLSEQLQALQLELKVGGSQLGEKNESLAREAKQLRTSLADAEGQLRAMGREKQTAQREAELLRLGGGGGAGGGKENARVVEKRFFHNTCLLVKLMLSDSQEIDNVPINELYDEARACHVHAVGVSRQSHAPLPSAAGVRAARADRRLADVRLPTRRHHGAHVSEEDGVRELASSAGQPCNPTLLITTTPGTTTLEHKAAVLPPVRRARLVVGLGRRAVAAARATEQRAHLIARGDGRGDEHDGRRRLRRVRRGELGRLRRPDWPQESAYARGGRPRRRRRRRRRRDIRRFVRFARAAEQYTVAPLQQRAQRHEEEGDEEGSASQRSVGRVLVPQRGVALRRPAPGARATEQHRERARAAKQAGGVEEEAPRGHHRGSARRRQSITARARSPGHAHSSAARQGSSLYHDRRHMVQVLGTSTVLWHLRETNVPHTRTAYPKRAEIGYGSASAGTAVLSPEVRRTPRTASARRQHPHQVPKVHEFHAPCVPARSERAESKKNG